MERMEYQREDEGLQSLTGTVERVVFRNEENGWTVLELEAADEIHKVVGVMPMVGVVLLNVMIAAFLIVSGVTLLIEAICMRKINL